MEAIFAPAVCNVAAAPTSWATSQFSCSAEIQAASPGPVGLQGTSGSTCRIRRISATGKGGSLRHSDCLSTWHNDRTVKKLQLDSGDRKKSAGQPLYRVRAQITDSAVRGKGSGNPAERRARLVAKRSESFELQELQRPLAEYMTLPASQYSVLDAERIERLDESTFKCYTHRLKFFAFEVCPVLTVRVEEQPGGCCIRLLSCTLEGSPVVVAQNSKFTASMENFVSWRPSSSAAKGRLLVSDTTIEVGLVIPPAFAFLSVDAIEATGTQVLQQLLRLMLPRFLQQLGKDYKAWASGDESRQALGTGEL